MSTGTGALTSLESTKTLTGSDSTKSLTGRQACNGFYMVTEPEAIVVQEENIAAYSLPQQCLQYEPPPQLIVYEFKNGDKERKLHCNTELSEQELKELEVLQKDAIRSNCEFFPSISVGATRYLSRARGDAKKALTMMKETQEWRSKYFSEGPIVDTQLLEDLKLGIVYFVGRDKDLRPTIVCRANRVPAQWYKDKQTDRLIKILIFCMEYMVRYMMVPGKVEGNNLIVDLKGLSAMQVPLKELGKLYSIMSHHYMGRVFKFYVINLSTWLSAIASAAKALLTDRQRQKLNVLSSTKALLEDFALHQLEEDHGGSKPEITKFFPFPLQGGPFEAGYEKGPDAEGVKRVDRIMTLTCCRGRLWDAKKSREENQRIEYPLEAIPVFKECGLPVPKYLTDKAEKQAEKDRIKKEKTVAELTDKGAAETKTPNDQGAAETKTPNAPMLQATAADAVSDDEDQQEMIFADPDEGPDITSVEVSPSGDFGFFSCRCCTVGDR